MEDSGVARGVLAAVREICTGSFGGNLVIVTDVSVSG